MHYTPAQLGLCIAAGDRKLDPIDKILRNNEVWESDIHAVAD